MKRRTFLQSAGASVAAGSLLSRASAVETVPAPEKQAKIEQIEGRAGMPLRKLCKYDEYLSVVGYPGLGLRDGDQDACNESLHQAFEQGVTYYDVAPAYDRGKCEIKMGIGLEGIPRDEIFLACKTKMRDAEGAKEEFERSLERLKTDRFDLYQMHCLIRPEEVEEAFAPGGCMEYFFKLREQGLVKYLGFSAHTTVSALEALKRYDFDTVMFPINLVDYYQFGFGREVLDLSAEKNASVLSIKTISAGSWPEEFSGENRGKRPRNWWYRTFEEQDELDMAYRFALGLHPVVAGIPASWFDLTEKSITAGKHLRPMTDDDFHQAKQMADRRLPLFESRQDIASHSPHGGCPMSDPHSPFNSPHEGENRIV